MSLITLRRHASCPLYFDFRGQSLKVIDHKGQPWFTAETIGKALGFADPARSINRIYARNKTEFSPDETALIEMEVEAGTDDYLAQFGPGSPAKMEDSRGQFDPGIIGKQRAHTRLQMVRIYSLRGAHHFGFFAKTELGKQFRQWVLDLIEDRHRESSYYAAFRDVVGVLSSKYPLWERVHFKFTLGIPLVLIAKELDVPVGRVSRAIRQMRHYKVLTDKEYLNYRNEGRGYLKIYRNAVKKAGEQP